MSGIPILVINPRGANENLLEALGEIFTLTSMGLSAASVDPSTLALPASKIVVNFNFIEPWDAERATTEYQTWVLTNTFQDLTEALAKMLEEVHATILPATLLNGGEAYSLENFEAALHRNEKKFHRLTLPDKFTRLIRTFGMFIDEIAVQHIRSINAAWNCYVHRQGIVSESDTDSSGSLVVHFRELYMFVTDEHGKQHEFELPFNLEERNFEATERFASRSFSLGERIVFDVQEISDLIWTCKRLGDHLEGAIVEYGYRHGYLKPRQDGR